MVSLFLSTPSARRATFVVHCQGSLDFDFYPRPPRGGRRLQEIDARKKARKFLSTPSARRATYIEYVLLKHLEISIHALREEGDRSTLRRMQDRQKISIHALREEGDLDAACGCGDARNISIHALREEGDPRFGRTPPSMCNFYPRPPRGGRRGSPASLGGTENFYPRPPRGGRRRRNQHPHRTGQISIHALREEGDRSQNTRFTAKCISIHALREEGDAAASSLARLMDDFYPRPPRGGRREW